MYSKIRTAVTVVSTVLGFYQLNFQFGGFAKQVSSKRTRTGKTILTSRSIPICMAINDPLMPLPAQFRVARSKKN